ncbi:PAK3 kinase, partial [Oxylabes madagascariensis]|nr:PAK3 kinase [Oxylabes madagascariensis]
VAIKKINLQGLRKKKLNDELNELMVMKMSRNANLVNRLDSYLQQFWLVMEYMDGGTLSDIISKTYLSEDKKAAVSRE